VALVAPAKDQGTPFHWKRDMVPGFKPAWTEIAQYITRDLSLYFQVSDRSPRGISTVAEI